MLDRLRVLAVVAAASSGLCTVTAYAGDPKVPPGQDPGGTAVALIAGGIDYTSEKIAPRLARDGEGELVGWDLIDNDRTPYSAVTAVPNGGAGREGENAPASAPDLASSDNDTEIATLLLSAYARGRLVPVKTPIGDAKALAQAIAFVSGTPARIVAIARPLDSVALRTVVRQAADRFKDHLFVVAGDVSPATMTASGAEPLPSLMNIGNVLVVAATEDVQGRSVDDVIKASDMLVMSRGGSMFSGIVAGGPPRNGREATVLAAAAAACQGHGRAEPLLGSAAKAATLDAGRPLADAPGVRVLDPMCWYGGVRY